MAALPSTKQLQLFSHGFNVYHACYTSHEVLCTIAASPHHMIYVETDPQLSHGWIFNLVLETETSYRYKSEPGVSPVNNDRNTGFAKFMGTISPKKFDKVDAILRATPAKVAHSERIYPMLSISWNWVLDALHALDDQNILDKFSPKFPTLKEEIDPLPFPSVKQEDEKDDWGRVFGEVFVAGKWEVDDDGELVGKWKVDEDKELVDEEEGMFAEERMGELDNRSPDGSDYGDFLSGEKIHSPRTLTIINLLGGELFPEF